jgi:hypothetical protein
VKPGAEFTKCFHNFSTIIPSTILFQANPDAPNSSTQGKIVEELWKNCRNIFQRSARKIFLQFFHNSSTILPQFFPAACRTKARKIFLQLFYDFSTIIPCWQFTLARKQRFYGDFVEEL